MKSDLGLTPSNDGKVIRINIPALTEERRETACKSHKEKCRGFKKIAVRNIRRDINEEIKNSRKEKHLSEDNTKNPFDEIQKLMDTYIRKIDEILMHKEKEIMEV